MNYDLRKNHKSPPIQYIKGWVEFYKLKFKVTPDTLIPRPETELLVDEVLKTVSSLVSDSLVQTNRERTNQLTILDVGTGAGNISVSIAKNNKNIQIIATDISDSALKIAKQNARLHGVETKITFIQSDLLSDLNYTLYPKPCTLILVTNLPYIPSERIPYLDLSVKDFEPHIALDGGEDGFDLYRKLFAQIKEKKLKFKLLVGEIDYTHGELAVNEAQKYFPQAQIEVKNDLAHKQRMLLIRELL